MRFDCKIMRLRILCTCMQLKYYINYVAVVYIAWKILKWSKIKAMKRQNIYFYIIAIAQVAQYLERQRKYSYKNDLQYFVRFEKNANLL